MKINFESLGLHFEADVSYTPAFDSDECDIEFHSLECMGKDAHFLLGGNLEEEIMGDAIPIAEKTLTWPMAREA